MRSNPSENSTVPLRAKRAPITRTGFSLHRSKQNNANKPTRERKFTKRHIWTEGTFICNSHTKMILEKFYQIRFTSYKWFCYRLCNRYIGISWNNTESFRVIQSWSLRSWLTNCNRQRSRREKDWNTSGLLWARSAEAVKLKVRMKLGIRIILTLITKWISGERKLFGKHAC